MTRRFAGSDLVRSARAVAESVLASWPALIPAADAPHLARAAPPAGSDEEPAGVRRMEGSGS